MSVVCVYVSIFWSDNVFYLYVQIHNFSDMVNLSDYMHRFTTMYAWVHKYKNVR